MSAPVGPGSLSSTAALAPRLDARHVAGRGALGVGGAGVAQLGGDLPCLDRARVQPRGEGIEHGIDRGDAVQARGR